MGGARCRRVPVNHEQDGGRHLPTASDCVAYTRTRAQGGTQEQAAGESIGA